MTEHIDSFLSAWTRAECAGDIEKLEGLLADDFCGVGPLGFILPRPAWLARHRELAYQAFDLEEIQTREHGGTAIVIHAKADDYKTDPSGNSGDRIACGVISK